MAFPGASFSLESVTQNGLASIRVRFTQDPRRLEDGDLTDALTPGNYAIQGPSLNYVTGGALVFDDPQAVDLYLAAPLVTGSWSLTVSNVKSDTGTSLVLPTTSTFIVQSQFEQEPLSGGAKNDSTENLVRKFLNPGLKGSGWSAFVSALAAGDRLVHDNARLAFDQVFLSSAHAQYLDRRASDRGVVKPHNVGMTDDAFRELAIVQANNKVVPEAVLEILEVFYGKEAMRAYTTSELAEPYQLTDGDDLTLVFNGIEQYTILFRSSDFERIGSANAIEVAASITRQLEALGSQAFAVAYFNKVEGKNYVRVYSSRRGVGSSVQVAGGRGQVGLRLPQSIFTQGPPAGCDWTIGVSPATQSRVRFTITVPAVAPFNFNYLHEGDVAYIYGSEFPEALQGSYEVKAVGLTYTPGPATQAISWFEVENTFGSAFLGGGSVTVSQADELDLMFFRPVRSTIYNDPRRVLVSQQSGRLTITMPVTSQIVTRAEEDAAYLNDGQSLNVVGVDRYGSSATFRTETAHRLLVGEFVDVQGITGSDVANVVIGANPGVLGAAPSTVTGTANACRMTIGSPMPSIVRRFPVMTQWAEGAALLVGGITNGADNLQPALLRITGSNPTAQGPAYEYQWDAVNVSLNCGSVGVRAILLSDGSILAYGGHLADNSFTVGSLLHHDANWNVTSSMVDGPLLEGAGLVQAGDDVFLLGGLGGAGSLSDVYSVALGGGRFSAVGSLLRKRSAPGACTLPNGKILVLGGYSALNGVRASCEIYNPASNTSALTGNMAHARFNATVIGLPDGRVLALGGSGGPVGTLVGDCSPVKTCEIYEPSTGLWSPLPDLYIETDSPAAVYVPSKNVVYVMFTDGTVQYLDCDTFTWHTSCGVNESSATPAASACALQADVLVVVGGEDVDANGALLTLAEEQYSSEGLNTRLQVQSVVSVTSFTAQVEGSGYFTSASQQATATKTRTSSTCVGPYLFDPTSNFAVTGVVQATAQILNEQTSYSTLQLDTSTDLQPALDFPDAEGWLVFSFGDDQQVGPVKYLGRFGEAALMLDASFKFPIELPAGTTVTLVYNDYYTQPEHAFWATDSSAGRLAAQAALDETVACGVDVGLNVEYPDDQGLGNAGCPVHGTQKLADKVWIWGGDDMDDDLEAARNE